MFVVLSKDYDTHLTENQWIMSCFFPPDTFVITIVGSYRNISWDASMDLQKL